MRTSLLFSLVTALLLGVAAQPAVAQAPVTLSAPVILSAEEDHQRMMDLLGIESLRPGPSPKEANTDEAKASPYTRLPDPLVTNDGQPVTTARQWWRVRRPEIVEAFSREVYGRVPANVPGVRWEVERTTRERNGTVPVLVKKLAGHVDNSSYPLIDVEIDLTVVTPAEAEGPAPPGE